MPQLELGHSSLEDVSGLFDSSPVCIDNNTTDASPHDHSAGSGYASTADGRAVWVGAGETPPAHVTPTRWACCGTCYEDIEECLHPGLQALLEATGRSLCDAPVPPGHVCGPCGQTLLQLAEACRGSTWWGLDGHRGFLGEVEWTTNVLQQVGIAAPADQILREYDGEEWPIEHLRPYLQSCIVTPAQMWAVIDEARRAAPPNDPVVAERSARGAVTRGEIEIARRMGWGQPQKWLVEAQVRGAAGEALNEAHFIELCQGRGVTLIPKIGLPHTGVIGYSAHLESIPAEHRREYGGRTLARDLALPQLRRTWGQACTGPLDAWATWLGLCADAPLPAVPPSERPDGRWAWLHPELAAHLQATSSPVPRLPPYPSYEDVWDHLHARQGGICAMCQLRRRAWKLTRGTPVPPALLGRVEHMDHDHETGLIRGLLCARCNTLAEPAGKTTRDSVWVAYTNSPPLGTAIAWRPRSTGRPRASHPSLAPD